MRINKMEILISKPPKNRWDKDSIRPGAVGSVGDVNLQVKLKKSTPSMPNRYEQAFSGKNEVWSGSNVSDGQSKGYTSGGRGAITLTVREGTKTNVGWIKQDIVATDRSRMAEMVPLGQYSWEQDKARIYRAKVSGEQFLPLPMGYGKTSLSRGSQNPIIVAQVAGQGIPLPAAAVKITDPIFGESGSIEVDVPSCSSEDMSKVYVPAMNDARRKDPRNDKFFINSYPYRKAWEGLGNSKTFSTEFPVVGTNVLAWNVKTRNYSRINTSTCGTIARDPTVPLPTKKERRQGPPKKPVEKKQKMM